jgi:hypothetical protein
VGQRAIFCRIDRARGNRLRTDLAHVLVAELATFTKIDRVHIRSLGIDPIRAGLAVNDLVANAPDNCQINLGGQETAIAQEMVTDLETEIAPAWVIAPDNYRTAQGMVIVPAMVIDLAGETDRAICLLGDPITKTIWLIGIYIANISTITLETTRRICLLMDVGSGAGMLVGVGIGELMLTTGGVGRLGVRLQDGCLISGHNQCRTTMAITATTKATRFTTKGKRSQQQTNMPRRRRQSLPMFRR